MAAVLAKLWRRRILAAAVETTTGTAVTIDATAAAFNAFNHDLKEVSNSNERNGQGSLSPLQPTAGGQSGEFAFVTELYSHGDGSIPAGLATLFKGAGFQVLSGGIMRPITPSPTTLTMGLYNDGRLRAIKGAALDATIKMIEGENVQIDWKGMGAWTDPSDVAYPSPTFPTDLPFVAKGMTVTVGGTTYKIPEITIALNNQLTLRKDVNAACGYFAAQIVGRKITVKLPAEALALATKNWSTERKANTTYALSIALGTGMGNICTIAAPKMAQTDPPNDKNANDIVYDDLTFLCCASTAAGDDELTATWS